MIRYCFRRIPDKPRGALAMMRAVTGGRHAEAISLVELAHIDYN